MGSYFYEKSKFYYKMHLKNKPVQKVCAIIKHENKFLALVKNDSVSSFPGGSVDANESVEDALAREVLEETNATVESFEFVAENHYSVPWEFKNYLDREKGLLRVAFENLLPHEVVYRKKSPYPKTHNPNYLEMVKKGLTQRMENPNSRLKELLKI